MNIAVLALQGAFFEHLDRLNQLGVAGFELRRKEDLEQPFDGLILPGGESTVQGKLLRELGLLHPIQDMIRNGLPVLGTCAGLILLAREISNGSAVHFGTLPVRVRRNAYGRQLGSFATQSEFGVLGTVPMTFIRGPVVEEADDDVQILAKVENRIVAVRYERQIGVAFHPELTASFAVHQYFLDMVSSVSMKNAG